MKVIQIVFLVLLVSCTLTENKKNIGKTLVTAGQQTNKYNVPSINVQIPSIGVTNIEKHIKEISYIPLETSKKSIIGDISKVEYFKDNFYILDKMSSTIFIFNKRGEYISKINRNGKGAGEYNKISDFSIDKINGHLVLFSDLPQKVIRYSLSGKFIFERKYRFFARHFGLLPNYECSFYLEYRDNSKTLNGDYNLIVADEKGNITKGFIPYHPKRTSGRFKKAKQHYHSFNNDLYFFADLVDTIYKVKHDNIEPVYAFDFGIQKFNSEILKDNKDSQTKYFLSKDYCYFYSINETQDILHFYFGFKGIMYSGYHSKQNNKQLVTSMLKSERYLLGDVVGSDDLHLIGRINQITLINKQKKLNSLSANMDKSLLKVINTYKYTDNPVLVVYKMKF